MQNNLNYKKYSEYKDSGVEWLGEIPKHWDITRLGTRFDERKTKVSDKDFPPLSVTKNGTIPQLDSAAKSNDGDNRKLVMAGDFVINSRSDRKGSSGIAFQNGSVSLIYIVMEPKGIHPIYCNYLLKSYSFIEEFYRMGHGIVADLWTTRYDEMKTIIVGIPPLSEQTAIAAFLDDKTAKIDKAILYKENMIKLLKERQQILIHKAVTKGLNPDVKMMDSGVEWIGEIPESWEVKRLKYLLNINNGADYKHIQTDAGYPVIGSGGQFAYASDYMYEGEVVFFGRKGTIDKPLYFNGKFWAVDTMFYAIPKNNNNVRFLYFVATTIPFRFYSTATALPSMTQSNLNNHKIALPTIQEQNIIVEYVEKISTKISTAITLKEQEIEKLKEYKSVLINEVVTGKVRVC